MEFHANHGHKVADARERLGFDVISGQNGRSRIIKARITRDSLQHMQLLLHQPPSWLTTREGGERTPAYPRGGLSADVPSKERHTGVV